MPKTVRSRRVADCFCALALTTAVVLLAGVAAQQMRHTVLEEKIQMVEDAFFRVQSTLVKLLENRQAQQALVKYLDSLADATLQLQPVLPNRTQLQSLIWAMQEDITLQDITLTSERMTLTGISATADGYEQFCRSLQTAEHLQVIARNSYLDTQGQTCFTVTCQLV